MTVEILDQDTGAVLYAGTVCTSHDHPPDLLYSGEEVFRLFYYDPVQEAVVFIGPYDHPEGQPWA